MNIGNKIKTLRLAKMLTQQELAGDMITRNMLSRIENGFALPSLQTLVYISDKLCIPAGYLLAEDDEEFDYRKITGMPDILQAFNAGDWQICMDLCLNLGGSDDEIAYIIALCMYNEGKEAFIAGDLRQAALLFERTKDACTATSYPVMNVAAECDTYLYCISVVSPLLVSDIDVIQTPSFSCLSERFCRYFIMLRAVDEKSSSLLGLMKELNADESDCGFMDHINARIKMKSGNHNEAYHLLKGILNSDFSIPAPMLYFIFNDLEICCRELSDYRGAYEYSSDRTGMLEKFLG